MSKSLNSFSYTLIIASIFHIGWYYIFNLLIPNAHEPFWLRAIISFIMLALGVFVNKNTWLKSNYTELIPFIGLLCSLHYVYLLGKNHFNTYYIIALIVVVYLTSIGMFKKKSFYYFFGITILSLLFTPSENVDPKFFTLFSVITIFGLNFTGVINKYNLIQELKKKKEELLIVTNSYPDMQVKIDSQGNVKESFKHIERLFQFFNVTILKNINEILPENFVKSFWEGLEKTDEQISLPALQFSIACERIECTFEIHRYIMQNQTIMVFIRDLTEQIDIQKKLLQGARNNMIAGLAGKLSHEINSPLMVIDHSTVILQKKLAQNEISNTDLSKKIEIIHESNEKIKNIMQNIRNLTDESQNSQNTDNEIDLIELNSSILNNLKSHFPNFNFKIEETQNVSFKIKSNIIALKQALTILFEDICSRATSSTNDATPISISFKNSNGAISIILSAVDALIPKDIFAQLFNLQDPAMTKIDSFKLDLTFATAIFYKLNADIKFYNENNLSEIQINIPTT